MSTQQPLLLFGEYCLIEGVDNIATVYVNPATLTPVGDIILIEGVDSIATVYVNPATLTPVGDIT